MKEIGKNIRKLREEKKLTQEELADRIHITRQSVSNYETSRSRPDVEMLKLLAEALDTDIETILYGKPKETPAFLSGDSVRKVTVRAGLSCIMIILLVLIRMRLERQGLFNEMYRWTNRGICSSVLIPLFISLLFYHGGELFSLMRAKKINERYRKILRILSIAVLAAGTLILLTGAMHLLQSQTDPSYWNIIYDSEGRPSEGSGIPFHDPLIDIYLYASMPKWSSIVTVAACIFGFLAGFSASLEKKSWKWNLTPLSIIILLGLCAYIRLYVPAVSLKARNGSSAYYTLSNTNLIMRIYQEENGVLKKQRDFSTSECRYTISLHSRNGSISENPYISGPFVLTEDESGKKITFRRFILLNEKETILASDSSWHGSLAHAMENPPEGLTIVTVRKGY